MRTPLRRYVPGSTFSPRYSTNHLRGIAGGQNFQQHGPGQRRQAHIRRIRRGKQTGSHDRTGADCPSQLSHHLHPLTMRPLGLVLIRWSCIAPWLITDDPSSALAPSCYLLFSCLPRWNRTFPSSCYDVAVLFPYSPIEPALFPIIQVHKHAQDLFLFGRSIIALCVWMTDQS